LGVIHCTFILGKNLNLSLLSKNDRYKYKQTQYQSGCLRRLHSLGQGHIMDITVEGFTSFMFKGLTFLLPFLVAAYVSIQFWLSVYNHPSELMFSPKP
ncbi:hypothetical protein ANCDUO_00343, partial [Ancylostoma duodenale]